MKSMPPTPAQDQLAAFAGGWFGVYRGRVTSGENPQRPMRCPKRCLDTGLPMIYDFVKTLTMTPVDPWSLYRDIEASRRRGVEASRRRESRELRLEWRSGRWVVCERFAGGIRSGRPRCSMPRQRGARPPAKLQGWEIVSQFSTFSFQFSVFSVQFSVYNVQFSTLICTTPCSPIAISPRG